MSKRYGTRVSDETTVAVTGRTTVVSLFQSIAPEMLQRYIQRL